MARAEIPDPSTMPGDAIGLLTRDHRLLTELFREFEVAAKQQLDPLARRICKLVRVHMQIKEELFFPAARRALADEELVRQAEQKDAEARQCIMLIESLSSDDEAFTKAVGTLARELTANFDSQERELFTRLRGSKIDLLSVGLSLAERRDTLLDVLGLHADDEEAAVYPAENPAIAAAIAEKQREREG
jgi:Hemerythrin HHE cation binding domain